MPADQLAGRVRGGAEAKAVVVTGNEMSWTLVVKLDPATGAMTADPTLPDGLNFDRPTWPHGG